MRIVMLLALLFAGVCSAQVNTQLGSAGLRFTSSDRAFDMRVMHGTQFRYTYHDVRAEGGRGGQNGADFSNFRFLTLRTFAFGHIFEETIQYRLQIAWISAASNFRVEEAFLRWAPSPYFNLTAGQVRLPATYEHLAGLLNHGFADRAIADSAFHQGWGKGIMISGRATLGESAFDDALLTWDFGVFNGVIANDGSQGRGAITERGILVTEQGRTQNLGGGFRNEDTGLQPETFSQTVDGDMMLMGRVEVHPRGEIPRHMLDLGALEDTAAWFFMVGAAGSWFRARTSGAGTFLGNVYHNVPDPTTVPTPASGRLPVEAEIFHATLDGHFRWVGFSLNWALHYRRVNFEARGALGNLLDDDSPTVTKGVTDYGATVDAGYFLLRDKIAVLARWSFVDFDHFPSREPGTGERVDGDAFGPDTYEYAGGLAWFIRGNSLRLTADYRYVAQQLPHGRAKSGLTSGTERTPDWRNFQQIRVQLQWIF